MLNAANEMELEHAIVCQVSKEIHMIKIEAVDENVNSMKIVAIGWHAFHTDALIHVLEFAESWHCAMYQITFQPVLAHLD